MNRKEYILTLSCKDQLGIVGAVTGMLAEKDLFILELAQFSDPSTGQFFMRIDFRAEKDGTLDVDAFQPIATRFGMNFELHDKEYRPKVLLMVSKQSHCLNDLLHRWSSGMLPIEISAVVSNHEDLKEMTSWHGVPFHHFNASQEQDLLNLIDQLKIDLVILARYMQILSPNLCQKLHGKAINIHHSFLPSFKGAKPYHQAYERGVKVIGATAHYVTENLDEGPIIEQQTIRVRHDQTPQQLVRQGCDVECQVLARAIKYHIEQRVLLNNKKTVVFS